MASSNFKKFAGVIFFQLLFLLILTIFGLHRVHAQAFDVNYEADTLPSDATPAWVQACNNPPSCPGTNATVSGGILTITDASSDEVRVFSRQESQISNISNVVASFRMKVNSVDFSNPTPNSIIFSILDGSRLVHVGFTNNSISFLSGVGSAFLTTPFDTATFHEYRLVKHGANGVSMCVDNSNFPLLNTAYGNFTATTSKEIDFGAGSSPGKSTSEWDYVRYSILSPINPNPPIINGAGIPVRYEADVLPAQDGQPWTELRNADELGCSKTMSSVSGGKLTISDLDDLDLAVFQRNEASIDFSKNVDVSFKMKVDFVDTTAIPDRSFQSIQAVILDGTRVLPVGFSTSGVAFLNASGNEQAFSPLDTTVFHTYRLIKRGTNNVELMVDDLATPILTQSYSVFSNFPQKGIFFGTPSTAGNSVSKWDYVRYSTNNRPPIANAGPDQTVVVKNLVTLNGSASFDPDSNPLTFAWTEDATNPQTNILSSKTVMNPTFTPTIAGTYRLTLTVNDGFTSSAPDSVIITVQTKAQAIQSLIDLVKTFNLRRELRAAWMQNSRPRIRP